MMKLSNYDPYIQLTSNYHANTIVSLDLPCGFELSQSAKMANIFFYSLDNWCYQEYSEMRDVHSSAIFLLDVHGSKPATVGFLELACPIPIPPFVVLAIWDLIVPGKRTSVLFSDPSTSLPTWLVEQTIQSVRIDGWHVCNQDMTDLDFPSENSQLPKSAALIQTIPKGLNSIM